MEADSLSRNPIIESFENKDDQLKLAIKIQLEEIIDNQEDIRDFNSPMVMDSNFLRKS